MRQSACGSRATKEREWSRVKVGNGTTAARWEKKKKKLSTTTATAAARQKGGHVWLPNELGHLKPTPTSDCALTLDGKGDPV